METVSVAIEKENLEQLKGKAKGDNRKVSQYVRLLILKDLGLLSKGQKDKEQGRVANGEHQSVPG